MFVKYDGSQEHIELLRVFRERLGNERPSGIFKNPFFYYENECETGICVSLWLLIVESELVATVITKRQQYNISGVKEDVYFLKYPVSLSTINKKYTLTAALLAASIKKKFKNSFLLGMGGSASKVAKFFESSRFRNKDIPFYLKVISWRSLLLHNPILSKFFPLTNSNLNSKIKSLIMDGKSLKQVEELSYSFNWWKKSSFSLFRTSEILNSQTPRSVPAFVKLDIVVDDDVVGGVILFETAPRGHRLFGRLNLWTILELEFDDSKTSAIIVDKMIKRLAAKRKVDILLFNSGLKKHHHFCGTTNWLKIKSNFCLSVSPELSERINFSDVCITRLDGDGPINLGVDL